jgi:acyl carrier protein
VTHEEQVVAALRKLLSRDAPMSASTHLRDDLGLDSASLIELTVLVHTMYGVDLGRKAAEHKMMPMTVGDLAELLSKP